MATRGRLYDYHYALQVGRRVQAARVAAGLRMAEASRRTGLSKTLLSELESARYLPGSVTLRALCRCYRVSADWLLGLSARGGPVVTEG